MTYHRERQAAIDAVRKACAFCQDIQTSHFAQRMIEKGDRSPVTIADFGAQALINDHLKTVFPCDGLIAEENTRLLVKEENTSLREAVVAQILKHNPLLSRQRIFEAIDLGSGRVRPEGRFWIIDPIDGTKGFLRGDQYAVALALINGGQVVLGVLGCPNLVIHGFGSHDAGTLFVALKEEGSVMRGLVSPAERKISVSTLTDPSQAQVCESFEPAHSSHSVAATVARILGIKKEPLRMDSQAKYGVVAMGDASIYIRLPLQRTYQEKIWDHAPGSIIVEEAGGKVTDIEGKPLDFSRGNQLTANKGVIATNGNLHEPLIQAIRQASSSP